MMDYSLVNSFNDEELNQQFAEIAAKNKTTPKEILSDFMRDYIVSDGHPEQVTGKWAWNQNNNNSPVWENNYALDWYSYGLLQNKDYIFKFMMHWIAFNWLYNNEDNCFSTNEPGKIQHFCANNYEKLEKFDAFSTPYIHIFLEQQIGHNKHNKELFENLSDLSDIDNRITYLLQTLYIVRCNLFHGSKKLRNDRDQALVENGAYILEGYLKAYFSEN